MRVLSCFLLENTTVLLPLFVLFFSTSIAASTLDQVFDVKLGSANNGVGACDRQYDHPITGQPTTYISTLNKFWDDTVTLVEQANIGLSKVTQDDDEGNMVRRQLRGWFGLAFDDVDTDHPPADPESQADLENIRTTFQDLQALLEGKFAFTNTDKQFNKLFCEGDWAAETTNVYDNKGNGPLMKKKGGLKSVHVHAEFNGQLANGETVPPELSQTNANGYLKYAYWIPDANPPRYMFLDQQYRHYPDPTNAAVRHICSDGSQMAVTDAEALKDENGLTTTFCNKAFKKVADEQVQVAIGPALKGKVIAYDTIAESSQGRNLRDTVRKRQPRSLTMLHEFVHAVRGPDDSSDQVGRGMIYGVAKTRNAAKDAKEISKCPEPYVYFAYAYWLSTVKENPNDANEVLYDWSDGSARGWRP